MSITTAQNARQCTLSIVMPAFNEAQALYANILETVRTINTFCKDFEVVVVDDGSSDNTYAEILKAAEEDARVVPLQSAQNSGKGDALKAGTAVTRGKYVAFLDADLDLHPSQIESFLTTLQQNNADVVIGSKMHKDSKVDYPFRRKFISVVYYVILRVLFRLKVHDTQTGLKLFRGELLRPIMAKILVKRFAYDIEVLVLCRRANAKMLEHPVEINFQRGAPWGRMKFSDLWYTGLDTLAIFYRLHFLKYYDKQA